MTISAIASWDIRPTVGSDVAGGGFDPSIATGISDVTGTSANTASPVIASATYSWVAGDVSDWWFQKSGTNWTPGWYQVASVASNKATLTAGVGTALLWTSGFSNPAGTSTAAGIATVASPTSGTGSMDYSQANSAQLALTGESTATTTFTTLAAAWTQVMVGNAIYTSGTGITTGRYFMTAFTSTTIITVDRSPGTTGTSVTMNLGGALATLGEVYSSRGMVAGNTAFVQASGISSISSGVTCINGAANTTLCQTMGYTSNRLDNGQATIQASAGITILTMGNFHHVLNLIFDGNNVASTTAVSAGSNTTGSSMVNCTAKNCKTRGFNISAAVDMTLWKCYATGNSTANQAFYFGGARCQAIDCAAVGNSVEGFRFDNAGQLAIRCVSANNSGASSDGFNLQNTAKLVGCVSYNNGRDGVRMALAAAGDNSHFENCVFSKNGGYGVNSVTTNYPYMDGGYNFFWSNTSGPRNNVPVTIGDVTGTGDPFSNGGGSTSVLSDVWTNFALNNTAGAGAACRAAGYPASLDIGAVQHADPVVPIGQQCT